jgi:hypothetical protein
VRSIASQSGFCCFIMSFLCLSATHLVYGYAVVLQ